jgi:hypothetical protein
MDAKRLKRPGPALVVAMLALFVALGGTAGAVATGAVPLAQRALVANNAMKLNGLTAKQIGTASAAAGAALPGPASSAAGLVSVKSSPGTIAAQSAGQYTVSCDSGQTVMGGGFTSDGPVLLVSSIPTGNSTWTFQLVNLDDTAAHSITVAATCLK